MLRRFREITKHPLVSGIILVVLGFLTESFLPTLFYGILDFITIFFSQTIMLPLWFASLSFIALLILLAYFGFLFLASAGSPKWLEYKTDTFDEVRWRWNYNNNNQIRDPRPYCERDNTPMIYKSVTLYSVQLECEVCGNHTGTYDMDFERLQGQISRKIEGKIRTNYKIE